MKKIVLIILLITIYNKAIAQDPVLPIFGNGIGHTGAYYKDIDNDFDKYVGTWTSTQGSETLTITLQKLTMHHYQVYKFDYYSDALVGEYKYTKNGVVIINTLPLLQQNIDADARNLTGGSLYPKNNFIDRCPECAENERRVSINFRDPERTNVLGLSGEFIMRYVLEGGIPKIKAKLIQVGNVIIDVDAPPGPTTFNVPLGEYVLTKVE